jgi:asparagine synthase (glutamine-hydrolysing)
MPGIVGIVTKKLHPEEARKQLSQMLQLMSHESFYTSGSYVFPAHGCYLGWVNHRGSFCDCNPIASPSNEVVLVFAGENFGREASRATRRSKDGTAGPRASSLLTLYDELGEKFLLELNGWFAGVLVDLRVGKILLFNDRFGVQRVYFHQDQDSLVFASEAKALLSVRPSTRQLDERALGEFLAFGSVFLNRTLFSNIFLLPGGSAWSIEDPLDIKKRRYFDVSAWEGQPDLEHHEFYTRLRTTVETTLPKYFSSPSSVGISLTGGLDTRVIMAGSSQRTEPIACYTYGGVYRNCYDVSVAREIAKTCGQTHHLIALEEDFFRGFAGLAEEMVWITDGCLDLCGTHEVYFSRRAREIAPIRLTGNYGSEVLRGATTFKNTLLTNDIFEIDVARQIGEAATSFAEVKAGHQVTFAAFKEIPWHLHGRLVAAQSQLVVRSPYMDNEFVSLLYQAPVDVRARAELTLRLISEINPSLAAIETDMAYGGHGTKVSAKLRRLHRYLLFKAEWYYNAGMPHWLSRLERRVPLRKLERLFLGSHKIEHYRVWFRDQLFDYVQSMLRDRSTATRPYLSKRSYNQLVAAHEQGTANYMNEIARLLTLELVQRLLIERQYDRN